MKTMRVVLGLMLVLVCVGAGASTRKKPQKPTAGKTPAAHGRAAGKPKASSRGRASAPLTRSQRAAAEKAKAKAGKASGRGTGHGTAHATARGSSRYSYTPPPMQHLTVPFAVHPAPVQVQPAVPAYVPPAPVAEAPEASASGASQPFLYAGQLTPFFKSLDQLQGAPAGQNEATVRVMQFGDSHTAADIFSGAVRAQLQARFGDGGLGFQFPGHPFAGYRLAGSSRSQSEGWFTEGNKFTQLGDGDLGLGGISISTHRAGEYILLSTTCTTLQVEYLKQAGGGRLRFVDNGVTVADIDTALEDAGGSAAGTYSYQCSAGMHEFQLSTLDAAPVKLLGWVTEQPGITYECLGINGAVATLMLRWNQALFAEYLRARDPNLIVLAYGTNEAVYIGTHSDEYLAAFERLLGNLHRIVPGAAILVLGPYDRATRVGRRRHSSWATFYGTERMIEVQKIACRKAGCAFYDEQARMGGPGSMIRWVNEGLGQGDHTHLTGAGYRTLADQLYRDLMNAYKTYQQGSKEP